MITGLIIIFAVGIFISFVVPEIIERIIKASNKASAPKEPIRVVLSDLLHKELPDLKESGYMWESFMEHEGPYKRLVLNLVNPAGEIIQVGKHTIGKETFYSGLSRGYALMEMQMTYIDPLVNLAWVEIAKLPDLKRDVSDYRLG